MEENTDYRSLKPLNGWGRAHIEALYGDEIRALGFKSELQYLTYISKYSFIKKVEISDPSWLVLIATPSGTMDDTYWDGLVMKMDDEQTHYSIITAFPAPRAFWEEKLNTDWKDVSED